MDFKIGGHRDLYFFSEELYSQDSLRPPEPPKLQNPGARRAGFDPGRADQNGFWCFQASLSSPTMNQACADVLGAHKVEVLVYITRCSSGMGFPKSKIEHRTKIEHPWIERRKAGKA